MIRKGVLKARAAHGYAWLQEKGPLYDLDVTRLQVRPELLDAEDRNWCPLARCNVLTLPRYSKDHFSTVCDRLEGGATIVDDDDLDAFLFDHGFDIDASAVCGTWGFLPGTDRDWRLLTEAWLDVIAANAPTNNTELVDHA